MPVTDELVIEYLLQQTTAPQSPLVWHEIESGGFRAEINEIELELSEIPLRSGTRLCLTMLSSVDKIYLQEPQPVSLIGRKYRKEEDRNCADLIRELARRVAEQCEIRQLRAWERKEEIRQEIFSRLLFGTPVKTR